MAPPRKPLTKLSKWQLKRRLANHLRHTKKVFRKTSESISPGNITEHIIINAEKDELFFGDTFDSTVFCENYNEGEIYLDTNKDEILRKQLAKYNWTGTQGNKKLSEFKFLHTTLFNAFKSEKLCTMNDYEHYIKDEIKKNHNNMHVKTRREKTKT